MRIQYDKEFLLHCHRPYNIGEAEKGSAKRDSLPSIIMANVQSPRSMIDDLQVMVHFQHDNKDACFLAFTETWLKGSNSNNSVIIDGFGIAFSWCLSVY